MAKVLVVDDEESIRFTFGSFLSEEGHSVTTAANYHEAIERMAEADFDLIYTDIILGDGTGIDVLQRVKERSTSSPVIIITGFPNVETASEAVRLGAFDYIPKPVRQGTLLRLTRMALQNKRLTDEKERYRSNLETIFGTVKDAIILVDRDMVIAEFNEAAKRICGLSDDDRGKVFSALPDQCTCRGRCLAILAEAMDNKESVEAGRVECPFGNGQESILTITASPITDHKRGFFGAVLVIRDETRLASLERDLEERRQFDNIIGKSEGMQRVYSLIEDLANVPTTVLVTGESGTGKELVAESLHFRGLRSSKPLVKVNCSALSENLLESELFGHVKGAFTGAIQGKIGRFERADGGTIFLDEIGDISPGIQRRLLRVLQEMEFERVGDSTPIKVDVRVIAATNQDLLEKVKRGEFREDLYYRLRVVELRLPPLRERKDDIPLLVSHFIKQFNKKFNKTISAISSDVERAFMDYPWPGNVRELKHTIEHAFILCRQDTITLDHLPNTVKEVVAGAIPSPHEKVATEHDAILQALEKSGWNKAKAARLLGISRRTIYRKMRDHGIA